MQLITGDHQVLELGIVLELQELGRWYAVAGDVDFTLLQAQQRDHRVLADLERDAVQVRQTGLEVVRVLLEQNLLPQLPLRQAVGASAHRVFAEVGAPLLDFLLGHDKGEVDGHDLQERRVRRLQGDLDGVVVQHLDARQVLGLVAGHVFVTDDRAEEPGARALGFRVDGTFQGVLDVTGLELATVLELHAFLQGEGIDGAILGDGVVRGQVRGQLRGAGLIVHQPVEQALDHRPVLPVITNRRVERGHVVLVGNDRSATVFCVWIKVIGQQIAGE